MGDAQSAQRENKKDAGAEEESGKVDDARAEQNTEAKALKNNGQISEINGKADSAIPEVNGQCEDEITAEAILSPDEDDSDTATPLEGESQLGNIEINEKESPNDADGNKEAPLQITELDAKQNDVNESFRRFFSNIGLKLTVKRGSTEKAETATDVPDDTNKEESNRSVDREDTAKETKSENAEHYIDLHTQATYDNDSTTCPTLTDVTSEDTVENVGDKTTEAKEEVESDNVDTATISTAVEDEKAQQGATLEEDLHPTCPSSLEAEVVVSPIKRFFTTGIFSGLRKKKKSTEDETTEKELVEIGKNETVQATEKTVELQQDKEEISLVIDSATVETEHQEREKENELKEEILSAASSQTTDNGKSPHTDPSITTVNEPETVSSQDKVQASPMKRMLSGSSLKKLSKKQRGRKSGDAKLSDSGEYFSDQLISSSESAGNQREESTVQHSAETTGEVDGAWASFKKLVTPKKRMKKSSLTNEEIQIPGSVEETKPSEGDQISDHSIEESKKRKDSSVSWEAVLCGSGRRRSRSRKTSDSEDEMPQVENDNKKLESPLQSSNEVDEILAFPPQKASSPSEGDEGSTWKSFKKLVTPKRKPKDDEEGKDNMQSDMEVTQDDSSFSIKKLLPGRKKLKSAEKQDQVSSDEADQEVASDDDDSETPAVVPLSEFDKAETGDDKKPQADVESHVSKEADYELQQDLLEQIAEPVLPCENEGKKVQDNVQDKSKTTVSNVPLETVPVSNEEHEDLTELISKHQQLSDIPEEGIITETITSPASVTEEAARDDTIAEDLIEITSEAITAPEPVDTTLGDETEMISAVSQLSESSNTSGNTTPVPVEYDVKHTDVLLHQVVETISISPQAVPVCSDQVSSERIVGSVFNQVLQTSVKGQPTILEIHKKSDAIAINTGLNVRELDTVNTLAATAQTESISEVNEAVSTEIVSVSEIPTEEFDTADISLDEFHEVSVSHAGGNINALESIHESQHLVDSQFEINEAVPTEKLPEGEEIVAKEDSLVGVHQNEKEEINYREAESAATVAEESKDGGVEQEAQTPTQKKDRTLHNITDEVEFEGKDQPPIDAKEVQELVAAQADTFESREDTAQLLEKETISEEDIPETETAVYILKEETGPFTEDNVEAEKKNKLQADATTTEHVEGPEVLTILQTTPLDSEGNVQSLQGEEQSEDISAAETVKDETKWATENLNEVSLKSENKELKTNTQNIEYHAENLEAMQVLPLGKGQLGEIEGISEATPEAETVTDEPKEVIENLTEVSVGPKNNKLKTDTPTIDHLQVAEQLEAMQIPPLGKDLVQSLKKEVIAEATPEAEAVTDAPKGAMEDLTQVSVEPENKKRKSNAQIIEHHQVAEVLEAIQEPQVDSEEGNAQSLKRVVIAGATPEAEAVTDEPKEAAENLKEVSVDPQNKELKKDDPNVDHHDVAEVLEAMQLPPLEKCLVQSLENEVLEEATPEAEAVTDEPKGATEKLTEVSVDPQNKELKTDDLNVDHHHNAEILQAIQLPPLEEGSVESLEKEVIAEATPEAQAVIDAPKGATENLTEVSVEPQSKELKTDDPNVDHHEVAAVLEAMQLPPLEKGLVQSVEKVIAEAIPLAGAVTDAPKGAMENLSQVNVEPENKELKTDAPNINHHHTAEILQAIHLPPLEEGSVESLEKEVIAEATPEAEAVIDAPKGATENLTEVSVEPQSKELKTDDPNVDHHEVAVVLEAMQLPPLEKGLVQSVEKVIAEDIPLAEADVDAPKGAMENLSQVNVEAENKELKTDAPNINHHHTADILQSIQLPPLEEGSVESLEKEVIAEATPEAQAVIDAPKGATENLTEVSVEPQSKELKTDDPNVDYHQVAEVLEVMQVSPLEKGCVQSLGKEIILEGTPEVAVSDKPEEEKLPRIEVREPVDIFKTEHIEEPKLLKSAQVAELDLEEGSVQSLEKEFIPPAKTVTDELKQATEGSVEVEEELSVEDAKIEHVEEPQVLPSDSDGIATQTETEVETVTPAHLVTESVEGAGVQELEKQILFEDLPELDTKNVIALVTGETESKAVSEWNEALKINEDHKTENTLQNVQTGQEDQIPEVADEFQTLTAVHLSSVTEEANSAQVREKTAFSEVTPAACFDNAVVTHEPTHLVHLSTVQVSVEAEKGEHSSAGIKSAAVEHAIAAQVITCYLKDVAAKIPDVLLEKTLDTDEPLIDSVASELEFKETVETPTPLVKDYVTETAEEGSVVTMMNVPLVQFEDNHRIQVQVVDVDIKSAKTIAETALEVEVTEAKVIDVCHETVKEVERLSAMSETEEKLIIKEHKVTVQEVVQHVKENLPETASESVPVNLEQEVTKNPDASTKESEIAKSELSEVVDQKVTGTLRKRQDEASAVICDDSATEQQVIKDHTETPDILGNLDVLIHDCKEDLEEPEPKLEKSEADVTTEEVKLSSEELDLKKNNEDAQIMQLAQSPVLTPNNTGLVFPENTGIISSIGNVEPPSSISLEFKLNIQFGQAKAPVSPPPTTEIIEPVRKTDVSEVNIQAVEPEKQINAKQRDESQIQTELNKVAVKATETTEQKPANLDSTERAVILNKPMLMGVGMYAMERVEQEEEIKSTERVTPNVQASETIQAVRQREKREVFLSLPVLSETCGQEIKVEEPLKQKEEENDQDVWMDAEEDINTQEEPEVSFHEVEEPLEHQTESTQEEEEVFEHEFEIGPNSNIEERESQQEMLNMGETCEIESEGEDFAVALEHPETTTASITIMEWD